jgi:hypothetical protein
MQHRCRAAEMQLFRNGKKIAHLTQFHDSILSTPCGAPQGRRPAWRQEMADFRRYPLAQRA